MLWWCSCLSNLMLTCVWMCMWKPEDCLWSLSTLFTETGSLAKPENLELDPGTSASALGAQLHLAFLFGLLSVPVLMFAWYVIYPLSHFSNPLFLFLKEFFTVFYYVYNISISADGFPSSRSWPALINSFLLSNRHSNKYGLIVLLICVSLLVTECVMVL